VSEPRVIVSLDYPDAETALALVSKLDADRCRVKVGKELFTRSGPALVEKLSGQGFPVFLDLKFHDIPHTVARACKAAADLGVWMLNVHAMGGREMLQAAREALDAGDDPPLLVAVTVLTSLRRENLAETGVEGSVEQQVLRLAGLARAAGLDGVVCSAREVRALRAQAGDGFKLVTPGIRPAGSARDDQKRVATPAQAIALGSDYLVIGRPITQAADPLRALLDIEGDLTRTDTA